MKRADAIRTFTYLVTSFRDQRRHAFTARKRFWPAWGLMLALALAGAGNARAQTRPVLSPVADSPQAPGSSFWVDVNATDAVDLRQIGFDLSFAAAHLSYKACQAGGLLTNGGQDQLVVQPLCLADNGTLSISLGRTVQQGGVSGSGAVVRLQFEAKAGTPNGTQVTFGLAGVRATSGNAQLITFQTENLIISIGADNTPPTDVALSSTSINENEPVGTVVGLLSSNDPDAGDSHSYTLVPGIGDADNDAFAIDGSSLVTAATFNFEERNIFSVRIRTTDSSSGWIERTFTISVTDVNDAPTFTSTPITTAASNRAYTYAPTTTDEDGDSIELSASAPDSWLSFTDNGDGTGILSGTPGGDALGSHSIVLSAHDGNGGAAVQRFTITVTSVDPVIQVTPPGSENFGNVDVGQQSSSHSFTVSNSGSGTLGGSISLAGPDASHFQLISGGGSYALAAGQSREVVARFFPASRGTKGAILRISHNATNTQSPIDVSIEGHGSQSRTISVSLPHVSGAVGDKLVIPVTVGELGGEDVLSAGFTISYDPLVLRMTHVSTAGTIAENASVLHNVGSPGSIVVAIADSRPLSGQGRLVELEVELEEEGMSDLRFATFTFNEGTPSAHLTNGSVTVDRSVFLGDANLDGRIGAFDASFVLRHVAGSLTLTEQQWRHSDVSGNGTVSAFDAALILQYAAGLITCFPAEPSCD